mmetsp:Transcript_54981/g.143514  ORF Transcript_54981/g.143514 Transcript_54981/m.143514 type:complete len:518 (+) Transcript_54981:78-1631(+)
MTLTTSDIAKHLLRDLDTSSFGENEIPYFLCTEEVEVPNGFKQNWAYLTGEESASSHPWLEEIWSRPVSVVVIVTQMPNERPKRVSNMLTMYRRAQTATMPPVFLLPVGDACSTTASMASARHFLDAGWIDDVLWGAPTSWALVLAINAKLRQLGARITELQDRSRHRAAMLDAVEDRTAALNMTRWQYLPSRLLHSIPHLRSEIPESSDYVAGFRIGAKLIRGLFGTMYVATNTIENGRTLRCSMLVIDKERYTFSFVSLKMINHHLRLMQDLNQSRHPNISHLLHVYHTPKRICVCTELSGPTTLYARLKLRDRPSREGGRDPLPGALVASLMKQLCDAVAHLHGALVCHRDIKPENLTISEEEGSIAVKLGGLELARMQTGEQKCSSSCGTMPFAAPEMIIEKTYDGMAADVWSVGIVFVELNCGLRLIERVMTQRGVDFNKEGYGRNSEALRKAARDLRSLFEEDGIIEHLLENFVPEVQDMCSWLVPLLRGMLNSHASERVSAASVYRDLHK